METTAPGAHPAENGLAPFLSARPRLFGIAYRMLGSAAEAEDVVQDVWMRWQTTDRARVEEPEAFLVRTAVRLSINVAQSARARRESYVGPWLPEPVDTRQDPRLGAERGEALELAVLLLAESLTPPERAAYVLREAFDYDYLRIAELVQVTEANARQLVSRARKHIASGRRNAVGRGEQRRLLAGFLAAAQRGDLAGLESLLAAEAVSYSDGGGFVTAARKPVAGRERVARFIAAFSGTFWTGIELEWIEVNGEPAMLVRRGGEPVLAVAMQCSAAGIEQMLWIMRPSKLGHTGAGRPLSAEDADEDGVDVGELPVKSE